MAKKPNINQITSLYGNSNSANPQGRRDGAQPSRSSQGRPQQPNRSSRQGQLVRSAHHSSSQADRPQRTRNSASRTQGAGRPQTSGVGRVHQGYANGEPVRRTRNQQPSYSQQDVKASGRVNAGRVSADGTLVSAQEAKRQQAAQAAARPSRVAIAQQPVQPVRRRPEGAPTDQQKRNPREQRDSRNSRANASRRTRPEGAQQQRANARPQAGAKPLSENKGVRALGGLFSKAKETASKVASSSTRSSVREGSKEAATKVANPKVLAGVFVGVIAAMLALFIILPDSDFSETENRQLQTFPKVSLNSYTDGTFQSELQKYVEDQFPFRDAWVIMKSMVSQLSGRVENNGVYNGSKGTLIQEFVPATSNAQVKAITDFATSHEDLKTYAMIAPTAAGIWADRLPGIAVPADQHAYLSDVYSQLQHSGVKTVDLWGNFEANKDTDLFYKTDHHWTTYGAQLAYNQLATVLGIDVTKKTYDELCMTDSFKGSLAAEGGYLLAKGEKLHVFLRTDQDIPCVVTYTEEKTKKASPYVSSALDKRDAYQVFFGGNHSQIQIESYADDSKGTLLVVKDSYANSLIPFLIGDYEKIIVVDPRYYMETLTSAIEANSVTDVLFLYNATTFAQDTSLARLVAAG